MRQLVFVLLVSAVSARFYLPYPEKDIEEAPAVEPEVLASYSYAVDFSQAVTVSQCQCMKQAGYTVAFIRGYNPFGQGAFDPNSCNSIQNAYTAGIGTEVYMTPQPSSSKLGYQQFDEMYQGLTSKGITIRSAWIQVTSPVNWPANVNTNINFISGIASRMAQYGLTVGIYTSQYDWNQITGGWKGPGNSMLWYWNVNGGGVSGETPANFNDFRSFGCWTTAAVKQFGQVETVCSLTVNRDIYVTSSAAKAAAVTGPTAGGFITV